MPEVPEELEVDNTPTLAAPGAPPPRRRLTSPSAHSLDCPMNHPMHEIAFQADHRLTVSPLAVAWLITSNLFTAYFPKLCRSVAAPLMDALGRTLSDPVAGLEVFGRSAGWNVLLTTDMAVAVGIQVGALNTDTDTDTDLPLPPEVMGKTEVMAILVPRVAYIINEGSLHDLTELVKSGEYTAQLLNRVGLPVADDGQPVQINKMPQEVQPDMSVIVPTRIGQGKRGLRPGRAHLIPRRERAMALAIGLGHVWLDNDKGDVSGELAELMANTPAPFLPSPEAKAAEAVLDEVVAADVAIDFDPGDTDTDTVVDVQPFPEPGEFGSPDDTEGFRVVAFDPDGTHRWLVIPKNRKGAPNGHAVKREIAKPGRTIPLLFTVAGDRFANEAPEGGWPDDLKVDQSPHVLESWAQIYQAGA